MLTRSEKNLIQAKSQMKGMETPKPHHSGKGTRARVNTAAEKNMFNQRSSK